MLLLGNPVAEIKYYTASVTARPGDPDQTVTQQLYFRALRTPAGGFIHLGHFLTHEVMMPLAPAPN